LQCFFQWHKPAQIEHKQTTPVWCDLDEVGWRVTSLPRIIFDISKGGDIDTMLILTAQISTNQAQTKDTFCVRFRRNGVENDVTAPELNLLYLRKENGYNVCFNGTNQHKQSTNE